MIEIDGYHINPLHRSIIKETLIFFCGGMLVISVKESLESGVYSGEKHVQIMGLPNECGVCAENHNTMFLQPPLSSGNVKAQCVQEQPLWEFFKSVFTVSAKSSYRLEERVVTQP